MKKSIFTRIISVMLICMMMIGSMAAFSVSAEETESATPTVEIVSNNVAYGETLKLQYAVKTSELADGQTLRVVICDADGNELCGTVESGDRLIPRLGETLPTYTAEKGVPAQNIATVVYAHAQIVENGKVIAEDVQAYSVLEYLWERLTICDSSAEQKAMYNALLVYAAAADVVYNEKNTDNNPDNDFTVSEIATSNYVAFLDKNGYVISGGMYQEGDVIPELPTDLVPGENEKLIWNVTVDGVNTPYEAEELANGYTVVAGATVISAEVVASDVEIEPTTVTVSMADLAAANGWSNEQKITEFTMDGNITVTAEGSTYTGKYYTSGTDWRIYQSENGTVTIDANGKTIVSVKITYTSNKGGTLTYGGEKIATGTVVEVDATSVTFGMGNTGTATNGQARITAIEVVYK